MGLIILVLFIAVPIGEIAVFIEAGQRFGLWPTIGAIIGTAMAGMICIRIQGLGVLRRVQESLARNEAPVRHVFDGLCLLVAGALLLTPGFMTDAVGFCLLFPPFRKVAGAAVAAWVLKHSHKPSGPGGAGFRESRGPVIDGEFEDLSDNPDNHGAAQNETDRAGRPLPSPPADRDKQN